MKINFSLNKFDACLFSFGLSIEIVVPIEAVTEVGLGLQNLKFLCVYFRSEEFSNALWFLFC
jgi:hypothetical protein